jgi:hypothetical protein
MILEQRHYAAHVTTDLNLRVWAVSSKPSAGTDYTTNRVE